ncbi:MAG: hypothetical protein ABMA01_11195 [Chthoniobacteraceae bacterium]
MINESSVNYNAVTTAVVVLFGLFTTFVASTFIFGGASPIATFSVVAGMVLLTAGIIQPGRMLFVMVPVTLYLDTIKRTLIFGGQANLDNVTSVLAVGPLSATGIVIGCVIRRIFVRRLGVPAERIAIVAAMAAYVAFGGLETFTEGNLLYGLRTAANSTVYFLLSWAVLQCFQNPNDARRFLKFSLLMGLPVALYGIWQYWFGLSDFEISYLKSGLSITAVNLDDLRPRPFSTLGSVHSYSIMMALMFPLAFHFSSSAPTKSSRWKWKLVVVLYGSALLFSLSRSATVAGVAMILFSKLFRSKIGTAIAYSVSGVFLTFLIFYAERIQYNLDKYQSFLPMNSQWQEQAFRLGTFSDRLMSYQNVLGSPSTWPLFANPLGYRANEAVFGEADFTHDLFSQMILRVGAVPVIIAICLGLYVLWRTHRSIFRLELGKTAPRALAAQLMAIIVVYLLSQSGGSGMTVFPLNFWLSVLVGLLTVICLRGREILPTTEALPADPEEVRRKGRRSVHWVPRTD